MTSENDDMSLSKSEVNFLMNVAFDRDGGQYNYVDEIDIE